MTNHERQLTSSDHAEAMGGLPTDILKTNYEFLRKHFDALVDNGGYDPEDAAHVELRNRMVGAGAVLSTRDLQEVPPEEEPKKDDDPLLRYVLTVDGGVQIITDAGANQIDAGGYPDPDEIRVVFPPNPPAPVQQVRPTAPKPVQAVTSTPKGRRVILH